MPQAPRWHSRPESANSARKEVEHGGRASARPRSRDAVDPAGARADGPAAYRAARRRRGLRPHRGPGRVEGAASAATALGVSPATVRSAMAELEALGPAEPPAHERRARALRPRLSALRRVAHARGGARPGRPAHDPAPVQPGAADEQRVAAPGGHDPGRQHALRRGGDAGALATGALRARPARRAGRRHAPARPRPRRRQRRPAPARPRGARARAARRRASTRRRSTAAAAALNAELAGLSAPQVRDAGREAAGAAGAHRAR